MRNTEEIKARTGDPNFVVSRENNWNGIIGRSPLLDYAVNDIDIVKDMRIDWMHNVCLGVGKEILSQFLRTSQQFRRDVYYSYLKGKNGNIYS
jgi:hypothetical protein